MRFITKSDRREHSQATVAQVSYSGSLGFGALAAAESRGVPVFAPRGLSYRPCDGDRLLLVRADGADVCVGCLSSQAPVAEGELALASAGGARIHLKNNGDVTINGLTITKYGRIISPGGEPV